MVSVNVTKKRKNSISQAEHETNLPSEDEFETRMLDGTLSQNGDETGEEESDAEVEMGDEWVTSDNEEDENPTTYYPGDHLGQEVTSGSDARRVSKPRHESSGSNHPQKHDLSPKRSTISGAPTDKEKGSSEDDSLSPQPNFSVTKDANGNLRYIYDEIDPVYDSDDTDVAVAENTIGKIPLSFYNSFPHIGYDINGKKIMRPARGEALDALLETVELPRGWTGLTDPATGKSLELSQDELEVLRKIHMNEIPEEGYDPYPVSQNGALDLVGDYANTRLANG